MGAYGEEVGDGVCGASVLNSKSKLVYSWQLTLVIGKV